MPDRARAQRGIPKLYRDVYDQVESNQSAESIAQNLEICVNKDIRRNGAAAKDLINSISPELDFLVGKWFANNEEFKQDIRGKVQSMEAKAVGDRLHVAHAAEACLRVCGMIGKSDIYDAPSEVDIQYRLNIGDGILEQIELQIWIDTTVDMDNSLIRIRDIYEDRLRNSSDFTPLQGNDALSDIDIAIGTTEI